MSEGQQINLLNHVNGRKYTCDSSVVVSDSSVVVYDSSVTRL